jgi:hypothetical protein
MGLGLDVWIYCKLYSYIHRIREYSAIAIPHNFQFTVTHALGFSVFSRRILATDLSQSHSHFKSHMHSSCNSLIPFLPFLLSHLRLPSTELFPVPSRLLLSTAETPSRLLCPLTSRTDSTGNIVFYCQGCVLTGPLLINGRLSIVACACVAGKYLQSRCLAMGIHVKIYLYKSECMYVCMCVCSGITIFP